MDNSEDKWIKFLIVFIVIFILSGFLYWYWEIKPPIDFTNSLQIQCENYNFSNDISIIQQATFFNQYKTKQIVLLNYTNKSYQCQIFLEMCQHLNIQESNINRTLHLCFDTSIITQEMKR